jgi:P-type Cu+ transporter
MAEQSTEATVEVNIEGMHCGSCSALIEETLIENPAIPAVSVNLAANTATITYRPDSIDVSGVCDAIREVGYSATPA